MRQTRVGLVFLSVVAALILPVFVTGPIFAAQAKQTTAPAFKFVAAEGAEFYHSPSCLIAAEIPFDMKKSFKTSDEAKKAGYKA
ncbi:MAG: hypothetical protein WCG06_05240, partial [Candidatus Omnitrophota bacterium]